MPITPTPSDAGGLAVRRSTDWRLNAKTIPLMLTVLLGVLGSIPLVLLTPPFQVPDENWHFYRAYELSELKILSEVRNGASGAELPASLPELVHRSIYTRDEVLYPATPTPLAQTMQHASIPLQASIRRFVAFPGSAYYSPLPYVPQALGIALGRMFGAGPLALLYIGRLFNCLTALALVAFAVYAAPFGEEIILLVGLLPMSLYLYASVSADGALISCALLFSALALAAGTRRSWKAWELAVAAAAAAVFCSVKPVYFPLLLAALVPQVFERGKTARALRSHAIVVGVALAATAGWMLLTRSSMTLPLGGGQPPQQIHLLLHHPAVFAHALLHSLRLRQTASYYMSAVGVLGWQTVRLRPKVLYLLPVLAFAVVWAIGMRRPIDLPLVRRTWLVLLAVSSALLVFLAMYLLGSPVGGAEVLGVQGRYFLPILTLGLIPLLRSAPAGRRLPPWCGAAIVAAILLVQIAAMDIAVVRAFQVF